MKRQKERIVSMSTLYELSGEFQQLLEMLQDCDELEEQVLKDTLEGIDGELEIKAEGYAKIIKELSADASKFEEEEKRLERRRKTLENRVGMLKNALFLTMKATGKTKFKTGLFSFGIQKNGGKKPLEIKAGAVIPDEYTRKETDAEKIREALEKGVVLPFAELKERGEHLRIR